MRHFSSPNRNRLPKVCRQALLLNFFIFIVAICFLLSYSVFFYGDPFNLSIFKDQWKAIQHNRNDLLILEDVFRAEIQPTLDKSIFFIESAHSKLESTPLGKTPRKTVQQDSYAAELDLRQGCSIEAAALHNPNTNVFVVSNKIAYRNSGVSRGVLNTVLTYPNVHFRSMDVRKIISGSPIKESFFKEKLTQSIYPTEHTSDLLRLLTLRRWGGTYLDLDVIMLRSLERIPSNFVIAQTEGILGSAVLNYASSGVGHEFVNICLKDFQKNYQSGTWADNGPLLITRNMEKMCQTKSVFEMVKKGSCSGIKVFPFETFYPVPYWLFHDVFKDEMTPLVLHAMNQSYAVHLWSHLSKNYKLRKVNSGAFSRIVEKNCPKIFALTKSL